MKIHLSRTCARWGHWIFNRPKVWQGREISQAAMELKACSSIFGQLQPQSREDQRKGLAFDEALSTPPVPCGRPLLVGSPLGALRYIAAWGISRPCQTFGRLKTYKRFWVDLD